MKITDIHLGNRHRKDLGDIQSLADSIRELGLLHPVVVTPDGTLIAGARRIAACKLLGWTEMPATVVDIPSIVRGEYAENACRRDFAPSEAVAIWQAMESFQGQQLVGKLPTSEPLANCARSIPRQERAAMVTGISHTTLTKARAVVDAAQSDPARYADIAQHMDDTGKVTPAYQEMVKRKTEPVAVYQPVAVTMFSSKSDEYYTPAAHIEAARAVLGGIDLDPASCEMAQQTVKAARYFTKEQDGLAQPWDGRVWLNPPYGTTGGQSNQGIWAQKLVAEYTMFNVTAAILLVKAALGYEWFESLWYDWPVCFPRQRLSFMLPDGNDDGQSKQASALFYFGPDVGRFTETFRPFGRVIMPEAK
jgi:ParB family chromosome partitioning protein